MNKVISVISALCLFTACQKDTVSNPSLNRFFISIDSSVGSLTSKASGDTFIVSLVQPWTARQTRVDFSGEIGLGNFVTCDHEGGPYLLRDPGFHHQDNGPVAEDIAPWQAGEPRGDRPVNQGVICR